MEVGMAGKPTYNSMVTDYLRKQIRIGILTPGTPVKEVQVAQSLGISRAPVREALEQLIQEGLLTSTPQKGKTVRTFTAKGLQDSYVTSGILESAAVVDTLDMWTPADDKNLDAVLRKTRSAAARAANLVPLTELDNEFHTTLCKHCTNRCLLEMLHRSCAVISKTWGYLHWIELYTPQEFLDRHVLLMSAMKSRDAALIEKHIREHYAETGRRMAERAAVDAAAPLQPLADLAI